MMKGKKRNELSGVVAERVALRVWKAKADFHKRSKKGKAIVNTKLVMVGKKGQPLKNSRIEVEVTVLGKVVESYKTTSLSAYQNKLDLIRGTYEEVVTNYVK